MVIDHPFSSHSPAPNTASKVATANASEVCGLSNKAEFFALVFYTSTDTWRPPCWPPMYQSRAKFATVQKWGWLGDVHHTQSSGQQYLAGTNIDKNGSLKPVILMWRHRDILLQPLHCLTNCISYAERSIDLICGQSLSTAWTRNTVDSALPWPTFYRR